MSLSEAYRDTENLLDTLERFGFENPGKCSECNDYGCSSALSSYIERITGTDSND